MTTALHVARNIRRLREAKGWTQQQLADEAGLANRQKVHMLEAGHWTPSMATIDRLCTALGAEPGEFFRQ